MITNRDIAVAALSATVALGAVPLAGLPPNVMSSALVEWNSVTGTQTEVGTVRQFFRAPTATLDEHARREAS